eukprot:4064628-Pyramimonas_sp.AAC.1
MGHACLETTHAPPNVPVFRVAVKVAFAAIQTKTDNGTRKLKPQGSNPEAPDRKAATMKSLIAPIDDGDTSDMEGEEEPVTMKAMQKMFKKHLAPTMRVVRDLGQEFKTLKDNMNTSHDDVNIR